MKIVSQGEYSSLIESYFIDSFPEIAVKDYKNTLDAVTRVLVGSKEIRYGPQPSPENLVAIRNVIRYAMDRSVSIPILVPWGGRKANVSDHLDIAEVSGIKQLLRVDNCVRKIYPPGLLINVRIEDINAMWLYKSSKGVSRYSNGMKNLIDILKKDTQIRGIMESEMMDQSVYEATCAMYSGLLYDVLATQEEYPDIDVNSIPAYEDLNEKGWKGVIPKEQRNYYLDRYAKLYPDKGRPEHIQMLADYFAGSKARYDLNGRGNPADTFIQINFAHPVPGAPEGIFNNTLYYRTVPASMGRTHIAPWRGKGYLDIVGEDIIPKVVYPGVTPPMLEEGDVELIEGDKKVKVRTDYTYGISVLGPLVFPLM